MIRLETLSGTQKWYKNIKVILNEMYYLPVLTYRAKTWTKKCVNILQEAELK
jgi:hypothetical protein